MCQSILHVTISACTPPPALHPLIDWWPRICISGPAPWNSNTPWQTGSGLLWWAACLWSFYSGKETIDGGVWAYRGPFWSLDTCKGALDHPASCILVPGQAGYNEGVSLAQTGTTDFRLGRAYKPRSPSCDRPWLEWEIKHHSAIVLRQQPWFKSVTSILLRLVYITYSSQLILYLTYTGCVTARLFVL